jgi:hypothetical protein
MAGARLKGATHMIELFQQARWQELSDFFAAGEPPMVFRILAINTILLIVFAIRKARTKTTKQSSNAIVVQALLIIINCIVMFQPQYFPINNSVGNLF